MAAERASAFDAADAAVYVLDIFPMHLAAFVFTHAGAAIRLLLQRHHARSVCCNG
jgi:hypothetical protein